MCLGGVAPKQLNNALQALRTGKAPKEFEGLEGSLGLTGREVATREEMVKVEWAKLDFGDRKLFQETLFEHLRIEIERQLADQGRVRDENQLAINAYNAASQRIAAARDLGQEAAVMVRDWLGKAGLGSLVNELGPGTRKIPESAWAEVQRRFQALMQWK